MRWPLVFVVVFAGCGGHPSTTPTAPTSTLQAAYEVAVKDAAIYQPSREHPLRQIPRGVETIHVVTWATRTDGYAQGQPVQVNWGDVWVTVEPEVQEICRRFPVESRVIRLEQLLGLPPDPRDRTFVRLDVGANALFRPCPNPDVSEPTCSRDFPPGVSPQHVAWMARQLLASFQNPGGYPWTRLGYTYNWRAGDSIYGPSEYVIPQGTSVLVVDREKTSEYCDGK